MIRAYEKEGQWKEMSLNVFFFSSFFGKSFINRAHTVVFFPFSVESIVSSYTFLLGRCKER